MNDTSAGKGPLRVSTDHPSQHPIGIKVLHQGVFMRPMIRAPLELGAVATVGSADDNVGGFGGLSSDSLYVTGRVSRTPFDDNPATMCIDQYQAWIDPRLAVSVLCR